MTQPHPTPAPTAQNLDQSLDQAPAPDQAQGPGGRRRLIVFGLSSFVLVTVLLAVAAIVLAVLLRGYNRTDDAREAALQAGRQSALNLTSIDTRDFDQDIKKVTDGATGAFLADFQSRSKDLKAVLADNKVISQGQIISAGIVRSDPTNATVLVVVDSVVQNTAAPEGRSNSYRMQLDLELRDGRWLTSMLQFVG